MSAATSLDLVHEPERAVALLHPLRLEILGALREPGSATSVAQRLDLPRQRVNYHLREIEKEGLVQMVEERRKGNCIERLVRATASHYLITPEVLGELAADPADIRDRVSSAYLVAVAAQTIRDLSLLRSGTDEAGKKLATFTLQSEVAFVSPKERHAFAEELSNEVARLVAKYHHDSSPHARRFKLTLGMYPSAKGIGSKTGTDGPEPTALPQP